MKITDEVWQQYLDKTKDLWRRYSASEQQQRFMCDIISNLPQGAVVVELGTCHGLTAGLFMLAGEKNKIDFTTIDNFRMDNNLAEDKPKLDALNIPYTLLVSNTQDVVWTKPIDFIFIDAGHDEANVKPDVEKWIPFVKSGGYVSFHDWDGSEDPSLTPHWAVTHYGNLATEGWKEIGWIKDQMMVRQKP